MTPFEKTWLGLLESELNKSGYIIYSFQKKGLTTDRIAKELKDHLNFINPDLLILQVGIVDCSPRALKESEVNFINKIPIIRSIIKKIVKKYYEKISSFRNLCYVDIKQFEKNLEQLNSTFNDVDKIIVPIGLPPEGYKKKSPLIEGRIESYNKIFKKIFSSYYLEVFTQKTNDFLEIIYTEDYYHLNDFGHNLLYECLIAKLPK